MSKIRSEFQGDVSNFLLCLRNYLQRKYAAFNSDSVENVRAPRIWLTE